MRLTTELGYYTEELRNFIAEEKKKNPDVKIIDQEQGFKEFVSLVKQMRKAQKNYYKDRPKVGYKVAYNNMINKEYLVDQWLEENL